jgi:hypothetical protein
MQKKFLLKNTVIYITFILTNFYIIYALTQYSVDHSETGGLF